ncbi:MAG: conjugal transfer protein [Thermoleophilia bacterium]|nr:conjugal transfer protein [Thermoleophilia bacterium]
MLLRTRASGGDHAGSAGRASRVRVAALAIALLAVVALALAPLTAANAKASRVGAAAAPLRSLTDAQLADRAAAFAAEADRIGEHLLDVDAERSELVVERDVASDLLGEFLAASYKEGVTDGGSLSGVLTASSLSEILDRARVSQVVADHHRNIIHSLDDAEVRLDVRDVQRAQLITRMSSLQARLVKIQEEQGRRVLLRADRAAEREAAAAASATEAARVRAAAAASSAVTPGSVVGFGGSSSGTGAAPAAPFVPGGTQPTAAILDAYLASKGSPMTGQGAALMASGQRWQVDPRLLVAIAGAESSFGAVTCGPNNAWGWACPNDPADFGSWADGIDTVTRGLRGYYLDEGRTSVALIQQKYCPVGAANDPTGLNSHWRANVTKFLLELGGNPAMVGPGPSGGFQLPNFGLGGD